MPSVVPHASALLCCVGSGTSHAKQKAGAFVMSGAFVIRDVIRFIIMPPVFTASFRREAMKTGGFGKLNFNF